MWAVCFTDLVGSTEQQEPGLGERVHELLTPWDGLTLNLAAAMDYGPCAFYLGRLEVLLGHLDDAVDHLERAIDAADTTGRVSYSTWARAWLARALRDRKRLGDERPATLHAIETERAATERGLLRILHDVTGRRATDKFKVRAPHRPSPCPVSNM